MSVFVMFTYFPVICDLLSFGLITIEMSYSNSKLLSASGSNMTEQPDQVYQAESRNTEEPGMF